jgi:hypothetical protein
MSRLRYSGSLKYQRWPSGSSTVLGAGLTGPDADLGHGGAGGQGSIAVGRHVGDRHDRTIPRLEPAERSCVIVGSRWACQEDTGAREERWTSPS